MNICRPCDVHADDVVDDFAGDGLYAGDDAGGAFAHAVPHVVAKCLCHMSPV